MWWRIWMSFFLWDGAAVTGVGAYLQCPLCGAAGKVEVLERAGSRAAARARTKVLELGFLVGRRC